MGLVHVHTRKVSPPTLGYMQEAIQSCETGGYRTDNRTAACYLNMGVTLHLWGYIWGYITGLDALNPYVYWLLDYNVIPAASTI